ncbi:HNH endonuclease [Psychrobacter vallis]|uniref:HNH endonuclease n=1 Tax=Psychrobacter vallis TaxID=248451 RepID=UPI0019196C74|nr:HNH endonuclease [Psychrobacter vallis]
MNNIEKLQSELEELYSVVGKATGYWANYYLRSVRQNGAVNHAKKALSKVGAEQGGFQKLIEAGRPELSMESSVLKPEYRNLFSQAELQEAERRLSTVPHYAWRKDISPQDNFLGEIDDESIFTEGAKKYVTVNVYERNPQARAECLKKHGYRCKVCNFSFFEAYGEIGKEFIHVHHIKPLAGIAKTYELNPTKDLVPVCPNCHAMLHTKSPPLSVDELRMKLKNLKD